MSSADIRKAQVDDAPVDVEELLAKFDKESATRKTGPLLTKIITVMLFIWGTWQLYTAFVGESPLQRIIHLGFVLSLVFLLYPASPKLRGKFSWFDAVLSLIGVSITAYYISQYDQLVIRSGMNNTYDVIMASLAILLVLEAARRVVGLPILIVVCTFLLYAYFGKQMPGFLRHRGVRFERLTSYMLYTGEGILGVPLGVSSTFIFLFIMFGSFLEKTGIGKFFIDFGNSIAGAATGGPAKVAVISSALQGTISGSSVANVVGTGSFTIPMMKSLGYRGEFAGAVEASASTGGQIMPPVMGAAAFLMSEFLGVPYATIAKAAVIPAILYFTGVFLGVHFEAKKMGLKGLPKDQMPKILNLLRSQAQLLLPVIAIVFFLSTGVSAMKAALYAIILSVVAGCFKRDYAINWKEVGKWESKSFQTVTGIVIAIIAALYVANVFVKLPVISLILVALAPVAVYFLVVYFLGKSNPESAAVKFLTDWGRIIIPIITFGVVFAAYSDLAKASFLAIASFFIVNAIGGEPRIHFTKLLQAIVDGSRGALGVAVACASAGMIVGVVTMTGLGLKLGTGLVELANNQLLLTMFFTMITSIILGMGVPTTANYVITSTIAAPAIIGLIAKDQALAAHLFVFYFGIIADVTPPVALAAFAGAGIAKADPFKTGVNATKLSIAAFMVPYCFVYNTNLLMINQSFFSYVTVFNLITAFLGMMFIAVGVQGWLRTVSPWWERILAIIGGLAMIGGSQFFHGVAEIFEFIPSIASTIIAAKDFFYSMTGEYLVNGIGLVIIGIVFIAQTARKRKYGDRSIAQIQELLASSK